jgi:cell division protease FtsH
LNLSYKNLALLLVIILMMFMLFRTVNHSRSSSVSVSYSDFLSMVESGSVTHVVIQGGNLSGVSSQGPVKTFAPKDPELIKLLRSKGKT